MRAKRTLLALMPIINSLGLAMGQGVDDLAEKLSAISEYQGHATFEVLLPSAEDPVVYEIELQSSLPADADTLAPCDYLIRWETMTSAGPINGFSAYFDGNHYRYRNNRLQEYHMDSNPAVFAPDGPGSERKGVQWQAQFADMIPQFMAAKMQEIAEDTAYQYVFHADTLVSGRKSIVVEGVKRHAGYDVMEFEYVFDQATGMPVLTDIVTSPGGISEQSMTIVYKPSEEIAMTELSEEGLIGLWPDVFEKYRESTFRAESLVGNPLPGFSCRLLDNSERMTYHRGEGFARPQVIVFIDPAVATSHATIEAMREAVAQLPFALDVDFAFIGNDSAEIQSLLGGLESGETALVSANTLQRNCGITLYPTVMFVGSDGIVSDVVPGYNKDLASIVIQKSMLLK